MKCNNKQAAIASKLDLTQFQYIKSLFDNRLGSVEIYKHKQVEELYIMGKKKEIKGKENFINELQKTQQRIELNHHNIMYMLDFKFKQIDKDQFEIKGYYEFPKWDLEREIKHRQMQNDYFSNQDLMRIAKHILNALVFLQGKDLVHGDLRPKYICYSPNLEIQITLIDRLSDSFTPDQLQIKNFRKQNPLYLSPIVFKTIANREKFLKHDPFKSELFALGLVLLQAALLKSIQGIYDFSLKEINFENLNLLIKELLEQYGKDKILCNFIIKLLVLQESQRMDPIQFLQYLEICNQKKFLSESSKLDKQSSIKKSNQEIDNDLTDKHNQNSSDLLINNKQQNNNKHIQSDDGSQEEIPLYESNEEFDINNNEVVQNNFIKQQNSDKNNNYLQDNQKELNNDILQKQSEFNKSQDSKNKQFFNTNLVSAFSKELNQSIQQQSFQKKKSDQQIDIESNQNTVINIEQLTAEKKRKKSVFDIPDNEYFSCRTIKNDSKEKIYIRKRKIGSKLLKKNSVTRKTIPFDGKIDQKNQKVDQNLQKQYYYSPNSLRKKENSFNINKQINDILHKSYNQEQNSIKQVKEKILVIPTKTSPYIKVKCENFNEHIHHIIYKNNKKIN